MMLASLRAGTGRSVHLFLGLVLILVSGLFGSRAEAQNVTVNPGAGSYIDLRSAFDAINLGTHTGAITVSIVADTAETAPAVLNASGAGAASYTSISITPSGARSITGAIVAGSPLIDFNGADNVTVDGLNTAGNSLTIANTTVSATSGTSTIRFIGGATTNIITNANIQGSGTMAVGTNGATIFFSTDALTANGNDNNTISNNNIGPAGANLPTKAILGNGSITTTAIGNSGNIISNNNIFDFFGAAVASSGVTTNAGCNAWSITNNRFYQTGTRTWTTGATHRAIDINNTTLTSGAQGFTITGNTVGFASSAQTGTYTLTGSTGKFIGIQFNGITGGVLSTVNNNTVAAVSMTGVTSLGTSTSSPFMGMLFTNGLVTSSNNTIGSQGSADSLVFSTTTTSATEAYGIFNFSVDDWIAANNNVGGISVTNLGASGTFVLFGMRANTSTAKVFNASLNNVGGTVADSIQLTSTGAASQVMGMVTNNAISTWTSNTVRNLTNNNGTGIVTGASVIGMALTSTTPNHTVSQNTIFRLHNSHATAATIVTGIQFTGGTANIVERNTIYGLTSATTSAAAAEINGIRVAGGTTAYRNNMIAVGAGVANAIGTGSTTGGVNGMLEAGGINSIFHNSVYVGGTASAGVGPSFAFNSSVTTNTRSFRDNIFYNGRNNAGATGKNYAVRVGGTAPNPAGLTINNNMYFAPGAGAVFGFFNSLDVADLGAWRTAVGQDIGSFNLDPQFNDPTNATPDLHIHPTNLTAVEGNGADVGVTADFDGQTRASFTPVDIGADAGNFNGIDLTAPIISYIALGNTSLTADRTLSVTMTDVSGVATGGLAPRIYYRKNAGSYFSQACMLSGGTVNNGTWNCTINNADVGGVVVADAIFYFVVAQDVSGNLRSFPGGAIGSSVNTITTPPPAPSTYTIRAAASGPINVGPTETFTSLTNAGGIFEALNASAFTGNVIINVTGDLTAETGAVALNQWGEDGVGGYTLMVRPSGARQIIGNVATNSMIDFNGADRVTIDGLNDGSNTLLIRNTGASSTIRWVNDASDGVLRNTTVEGAPASGTVVAIAAGTVTGNDNIQITNNVLRDRTDAAGVPFNVVGSTSTLVALPNSNTVIAGNTIQNFNQAGVFVGVGTENISVTGNTIFQTAARTTALSGIAVNGTLGTNVFNNNLVRDLTSTLATTGITVSSALGTNQFNSNVVRDLISAAATTGMIFGDVRNTTVAGNRVFNLPSTTGNTAVVSGVVYAGGSGTPSSITLSNNFVSIVPGFTNNQIVRGIVDFGFSGNSFAANYNSVYIGGTASGSSSWAMVRRDATPTNHRARNNILFNDRTGGTSNFAFGDQSANTGTFDSNFNFVSGAGANFMDYGTATTGTPVTLATWQAGPPARDANSVAGPFAPLGDFFVNAAAGDLHIQVTALPVINTGTPVAGITQDIDGNPRNATTPEIGADELVDPNTPPSITPTAGGIARTQGSAASNSQIAVVSDTETAAGSLVVTAQTLPTGITVSNIVNTGGAITADVAASCSAATGANLVGLRVTDAGTLFTDANLTVNVAANTAPVLGTYPASNATTGIGITVTPNAAPSDNGSIVSITASAPGFTGSFSVNTSSGVVTVTNPGPANVYTVTVTATDDCGQTSTTTFQLTVSNSNAAPVITPAATVTRQRGSAASSAALATVTDDTSAQNVVVTAQTVPAGLTVTGIVNTAGAITGNVAASCTATLGSNTVVLRATDPGTLFADGNLTVDVTANTAVVQGIYPATSVNAGAGTTVTPDAAPSDNGSISSITAAAPGFTGSFSVNTSTGVVTVSNAGPGGVFTVTVTATDNCGTTSTRTFTLTVNALPNIVAASVTPKAGDAASVRTIANVSDNEDAENTLAVTINGGATATSNGVTVGSIAVDAGGIVTANVLASCGASDASFTLRVTDSGSLFRETTLNTVVTANTAPLLSYGSTTLPAGTGVVIGPNAGPSDSGSITSIVVQSPGTYTGGVTVAPSGNVTLTNAAPDGSHTLTIRATDNCGMTTDAALLVTVLGDVLFANGFEDLAQTPAKMKLPLGDEGVTQTLVLPVFELQELAAARGIVDVVEFEIGSKRSLLQVRGDTGYREARLLDIDSQGSLRTGAWMEISGQAVLQLQWRTQTVESMLQVQTALTVVRD